MKKNRIIPFFLLLMVAVSAFSQSTWTVINDKSNTLKKELEFRESEPTSFDLFELQKTQITKILSKAVRIAQIVELPTPYGVQRFSVQEAAVMAPELSAKFPNIKSYVGVGLDDATARVRLSTSQIGLHAMISSGKYPMYLIDPYTKDKNTAIAYFKKSSAKSDFECLVEDINPERKVQKMQKTTNANDGKLRTYRMALIGTAEYSQFHITNQNVSAGATDAVKKAAVLSAMNATMTRINGVFERDLGVTMQLVANNSDLIFLDAASDGLTNSNINSLVDESQIKCDAVIGAANYDIGHVFGWVDDESGNGLAGGGVVCENGQKAQGATMRKTPMGDLFDIDLAAHEIGHQFGANHTQNGDCNRFNATAVEPGSGTTIMGYAGFCPPDVQNNSDAYFHAVSIAEMWTYVTGTATCGVESATGNLAPTANAGSDVTVPKLTPLVLKGLATDADAGNSLTYAWEQLDNQTGVTIPPAATSTGGPLFRSFSPSSSSDRYLPALATVLAGNISTTWEVLPSVSRTINFGLTVRDNVLNGGATARDDVVITVDGNSGPFVVQSQGAVTTLNGNSTQTVTWDVANTQAAPVNTTHVDILLSTDGGLTYPNVLLANTPNDGSQDVVITNITTTQARIKVAAVNNIFYAVNAVNFSIDKTTSVEDVLFANFKMYPNPSAGKLTVSFNLNNASSAVQIQLFDIRGRLIKSNAFAVSSPKFTGELDYQAVSKGMYVLSITQKGRQISKKILLK